MPAEPTLDEKIAAVRRVVEQTTGVAMCMRRDFPDSSATISAEKHAAEIAAVLADYLEASQPTPGSKIKSLEAEVGRLRSENLRLHGKLAAGEFEHIAAAKQAGAEKMRERAALEAFSQTSDDPQPGDWNEACEHTAEIIRALPLPGEE